MSESKHIRSGEIGFEEFRKFKKRLKDKGLKMTDSQIMDMIGKNLKNVDINIKIVGMEKMFVKKKKKGGKLGIDFGDFDFW